jgi:excisionase family DNA binding protein
MDARQLAGLLGCSTRHVSNLARRGLLRPVRLGRCIRYRRASVERALAAMEGTP